MREYKDDEDPLISSHMSVPFQQTQEDVISPFVFISLDLVNSSLLRKFNSGGKSVQITIPLALSLPTFDIIT